MHYFVIKVGHQAYKTLKLASTRSFMSYANMKIKKRFIAGVRCPKCNRLDRIIMLTHEQREWIECIECDYSDNRPTPEQIHPNTQDDIGVIQFKPRNY